MGACACKKTISSVSTEDQRIPVLIARVLGEQPRLELGNNSDYTVSYWVLHEDKMKTKAAQQRVLQSIEMSLNATAGGGQGVAAGVGAVGRREKEVMTELVEEPYFLMRDHRMSRGVSQTVVPFPKDCLDLRVHAAFQRKEDKVWVPYKDKVYSIGRGDRVCTLHATNAAIAPYL
ncbi:unnamed protein product [Scytosiphon promiscuus]